MAQPHSVARRARSQGCSCPPGDSDTQRRAQQSRTRQGRWWTEIRTAPGPPDASDYMSPRAGITVSRGRRPRDGARLATERGRRVHRLSLMGRHFIAFPIGRSVQRRAYSHLGPRGIRPGAAAVLVPDHPHPSRPRPGRSVGRGHPVRCGRLCRRGGCVVGARLAWPWSS
jgi:hypothetical protein